MRKFRYDYYTIQLPRDMVIESSEDSIKELGQYAVNEANERARFYCIPALWEAKLIDFNSSTVTFSVRRKRNNVR